MVTCDLPATWLQILKSLTAGPLAWRTPTELAGALGRDRDELTDELATMDVAGWLDVWERPAPSEIVVTLSAWGAGRLGVRLAENGGGLSYRWIEADQPEPGHFRARGVAASAPLEELDLVLDTRPAPGASIDDLDEAEALDDDAPGAPRDWPCPTHLVGEGLTPWPGPAATVPVCPACRGRRLGTREYCLRCDRWGLDHRLRQAADRERARTAPRSPGRDEPAQTRRLRDRRKARRRSRLTARFANEAGRHRTGTRSAS